LVETPQPDGPVEVPQPSRQSAAARAAARIWEAAMSRSASLLAGPAYWEEIDACKREVQIQAEDTWWQVGAAAGLTAGSVGSVLWLLRGTSLLAAAASTMPAWASFDALPVLEFYTKEIKSRKQPAPSRKDGGHAEEAAEDVFR
jgi:hypothetical protein